MSETKEERALFIEVMIKKFNLHNRLVNQNSIYLRFVFLPEWMQWLGFEFLTELEAIHDNDINWSFNGLSATGDMNMDKIITRYVN